MFLEELLLDLIRFFSVCVHIFLFRRMKVFGGQKSLTVAKLRGVYFLKCKNFKFQRQVQ